MAPSIRQANRNRPAAGGGGDNLCLWGFVHIQKEKHTSACLSKRPWKRDLTLPCLGAVVAVVVVEEYF